MLGRRPMIGAASPSTVAGDVTAAAALGARPQTSSARSASATGSVGSSFAGVGRELDELGDEIRELAHFELDALDHLAAARRARAVGPAEQLGVRAQAA